MSKEIVVSSTRHETRVAVLENDQLVEIYFQREKEYSLAGSIHKGRVTRVLPGMQSAFVDLGLERDAFLYVSDFFEDNEEYEKVVTSVEDKVLRMEKGAPAAPAAAPLPAESGAESTEKAPGPMGSARPAGAPAASAPVNGDRRSRRSRRRRHGRGFPESKYASRQAPAAARHEEQPSTAEDLDFPVLPGESLAKYSRHEMESAEESPAEAEVESETAEDAELVAGECEVSPLESEAPEPSPGRIESAEPAGAPISEAAHSAALSEGPEDFSDLSAQPDSPESPSKGSIDTEETPSAAEACELPEQAAEAEATLQSAAEREAESVTEEPAVEPSEATEAEPVSATLSAAVREQGSRYLPRVSRRMRRKMRSEERRSETAVAPGQRAPAAAQRAEKQVQPSISELLREGQEIIVQIAKEPLGQKGARITSHIALPGRYLVYMPTVEHIGVSRKIAPEEERSRLKRVLQTHRAGIPGGFIVRTAGAGKSEEDLRADMMFLYDLWMDIRQRAEKKKAPALIHHDLDVVQRVLRDQLTPDFKNIWVDNEEVYENVLGFVQRFQPGLVGRVKLYTRPTPIFDAFSVTPELEKALRPKVWLKSGGYIVINQTEALVAIDINTGKYVGKSNRLEDTIVKTNTDAVREIVRQIRLRDLGGIIVVDFIDMDERKNRQKVMQALEEAMRSDRAPYKILAFNDFGLVAITRKRVKQSLERTLCSPCPYCEAAGYVKSPETVVGEILQEASKVAGQLDGGDVILRVNPEVARLLKSSDNTYLQELEEILNRNVVVKSDPLLHQEKFDLA